MQHRVKLEPTRFSKKRNNLEVMFDVLKICNNPQISTHIMQKANLSHGQLKAVLEVLEKRRLLEVTERSGKKCLTSAKGKEYVQRYNELQEMTRPLKEEES